MPRSHLVAYLVIAAAAGFLGGVLFEHGRTPAAPGKGGEADAAPVERPAPPPRPDAAARAEKAIGEKRWPDAVTEIRALIAEGPARWDDALALIVTILNVDDIVEYTMRESYLEPLAADVAFHKHAVPLARGSDSFGSELYLEQAFAWLGEAHEGKFLYEALDGADDTELPRILRALEGNVTKEMLPGLEKLAKDSRRFDIQVQVLKMLASAGPDAESVLRDLAASPDRLLAESAAAALQVVKPPATGFLVLQVPGREDRPNGKPRPGMLNPLHRGDIITQVVDLKIDSEQSWGKAVAKFGGRAMIEIKVVRKGETVSLSYPSPMGAPKGRFVTAAR